MTSLDGDQSMISYQLLANSSLAKNTSGGNFGRSDSAPRSKDFGDEPVTPAQPLITLNTIPGSVVCAFSSGDLTGSKSRIQMFSRPCRS